MKDTNKLSMESFNITNNDIKHDLSYYYSSFSKKQIATILKRYDSVESYVNILYWLKFIARKDYIEIGKCIGINKINVYILYYDLGWGYYGTFEQNSESLKKDIEYVESFRPIAMKVSPKDINIDFNTLCEKAKKLRKDSYINFGFNSPIQYLCTMHYLVEKIKFTTSYLSLFLHLPYRSVQNKMENIQLNRTLAEAQNIIKDTNRRDYERINKTTNRTRAKNFIENGLTGSISENDVRIVLNYVIYDFFDINRFDIIIGINTKYIISPKEIDIPIIIYDNYKNITYRFAIEYNGEWCHKEKDLRKIKMLEKRGWHYLDIWEFSTIKVQKDFGVIEEQIENICLEIKKYVDL